MRKFKIYAMTTAAAFAASGLFPLTALAAQTSFNIPGGKAIVVSGNNLSSLNDLLNQLGNNGSLKDCIQNLPGWNLPGGNLPGGSLPDFEIPGNPDTNLPDIPGIPGLPDNDGSHSSFEAQVVELVNAERAKAGLSPLTLDSRASQAARVRSQEIQTSFTHTRPDGSSFSTALTQAGVSYRSAGENIAYGQSTPEQVMSAWMNSSGHRANILNSSFTSIGVGYVQNSSGTPYWTQLFFR